MMRQGKNRTGDIEQILKDNVVGIVYWYIFFMSISLKKSMNSFQGGRRAVSRL